MPRSFAALLACLFAFGCSQNIPPEPPEPPRPLVVVEPDDPLPPPVSPVSAADQDTRQTGLRVMATEQRALLQALENETRFERTSFGAHTRVRQALFETHRDLSAVERAISVLGDDESMSAEDRHVRQDELKERLRRLATRLALMENAVRGR
jgi:hypothetical protein